MTGRGDTTVGTVVVVGAGMAAARLVEHLRESDDGQALRITLIGAEPRLPYNRVLLPGALADPRRLGDLTFRDRSWYRNANIDVALGGPAVSVDRRRRLVTCVGGREFSYDALVLATGAKPPPLHPAVGALRTHHDCVRLVAAAAHARRAVVVGGGSRGIEAARALVSRGLDVAVVHAGPHMLHDHLDPEGGELLHRHLERLGISVHTGGSVSAVNVRNDRLHSLELTDGSSLECDLALVACGSQPSTRLAAVAGLTIGRGIVVDDRLRSIDDPAIYAIGDCAQPLLDNRAKPHALHGHPGSEGAWTAWAQADVVAELLLGRDAVYRREPRALRLRAAGLDVAVIGEPLASGPETEIVRLHNPLRGSYKKLAFSKNRLIGAMLVGDTSAAPVLAGAFDRPWLPTSQAALLLGTAESAARTTANAADLDASATVCACNGVDAAGIRAIAANSLTAGNATSVKSSPTLSDAIRDVVRETRATTGCGGCATAVSSIVAATLGDVTARAH